MTNNLGERIKAYEKIETSQKYPLGSCLYVRLDGRSFSKLTKDLDKPFHMPFNALMKVVAGLLLSEFNAVVTYTQSDEISLIILNDFESPAIFEAKKHKLLSVIPSYASSIFASYLRTLIPDLDPVKTINFPSFDCRITPMSKEEAVNALLWREKDAIKNSINMVANHKFSHKELHKKSTEERLEMLRRAGIDWEENPPECKTGTYFKRHGFYKETDGIKTLRHCVKAVDGLALTNIKTAEERFNRIFVEEGIRMKLIESAL